MLIAQQEAIDANPDHEFYSLNIDAGGMWVRRILDRMLQAEGLVPPPRPQELRRAPWQSTPQLRGSRPRSSRRPTSPTAYAASCSVPTAPVPPRPGSHLDVEVDHDGTAACAVPTRWCAPRTTAAAGPSASSWLASVARRVARHARACGGRPARDDSTRCRTSRSGSAPPATCWSPAASASPRWSPWPPRCDAAAPTTRSSSSAARAAVMAYLDDLVAEHGDRVRVHVDDEGTPSGRGRPRRRDRRRSDRAATPSCTCADRSG